MGIVSVYGRQKFQFAEFRLVSVSVDKDSVYKVRFRSSVQKFVLEVRFKSSFQKFGCKVSFEKKFRFAKFRFRNSFQKFGSQCFGSEVRSKSSV